MAGATPTMETLPQALDAGAVELEIGLVDELDLDGTDVGIHRNYVFGQIGVEITAVPLHSRHRGAAADPGPLIGRTSLDIRSVNSSILERNSLRIGEVFELL
jgi:hypothetical protein